MEILLDGVSSTSVGLYVKNKPAIPSAQRDVESTPVPGSKYGSLTRNLGWKDVSVSVDFGFYDMKGWNGIVRKVNNWVQNKKKLVFSDDTGFYRKIKGSVIGNAAIDTADVVGNLQITFTLDPFWYEETNSETHTANFNITNPSAVPSDPLITIQGSGTVEFSVNGKHFKILDVTDSVTIDSQTKTVTSGSKNLDTKATGDFPELISGKNAFLFVSNVKSMTIDKRWMYL